jgi:hypothetical protein
MDYMGGSQAGSLRATYFPNSFFPSLNLKTGYDPDTRQDEEKTPPSFEPFAMMHRTL